MNKNYNINDSISKIIGKGVDFPFKFDYKGVSQNSGIDLINDSIHMILGTCKGTRLFEPEFGSNLCYLIFEPISDILFDKIKIETVSALHKWEKRIKIKEIKISSDDLEAINNNIINIYISYIIKNTFIEGNYVYPFKINNYYKRE